MKTKQNKEISVHSWQDHIGHISRSNQTLTRVKIHSLWIAQHAIWISVLWSEKGIARRKFISPFALAYLQQAWLSNDVISDDDSSVQPMETILPYLTVAENGLLPDEVRAVRCISREINLFLQCTRLDLTFGKEVSCTQPQPVILETVDHSWFEYHSYVILVSGQVTPVKIGSLVMLPHRTVFRVYWTAGKLAKRTLVTPLALLLCWYAWWQSDLLVEEEVLDSPTRLPELVVRGVSWAPEEVNRFIQLLG